jgi:hypothetical protein
MIQTHPNLPQPIARMLTQLRRQIRWYVWLEGLAFVLIWLAAVYWIGLALDYLPVTVGASEMPRAARAVLLLVLGGGAAWLLVRFIGRRAFARLPDQHLALLLERHFPQLDDALLTVVDNTDPRSLAADAESPNVYDALLARTRDVATERIQDLAPRQLLTWRRLGRIGLLASLLVGSIAAFASLRPAAAQLWHSRLLLRSDQPWPRRAFLEVLDFPNSLRKVAEGSNLVVRVRADARRTTPPPEVCAIDYVLSSGANGRVNMVREGEPRDGFQYYRYEGQPFQGMLEDVQFDVLGLDARVEDFQVRVVPSPAIADVQLDCVFPTYTQLPPRRQPWRPGTSLPAGARVRMIVQSTKPLREATVFDPLSGDRRTIAINPQTPTTPAPSSPNAEGSNAKSDADANAAAASSFELELPVLQQPVNLEIELLDQDDVPSQQPYRVSLQITEDTPPVIEARLQGIGSAITPDALIAVTGEVKDDYGVARSWFQVQRSRGDAESSSTELPVDLPRNGQLQTEWDLRQARAATDNPFDLQPGDKMVLGLRAVDECDLADKPQEGRGDEWPLEVVTADELLALLEARELGQKRRFEQILAELTETRDSLARLQATLAGQPESDSESDPKPNQEPAAQGSDAQGSDGEDEEGNADSDSVLRLLRVQRAQQQGLKSQQEVAGVAAAFADIRAELINNRVDTPERRDRLQRDIIEPLEALVTARFDDWLKGMAALEQQVGLPQAASLCSQSVQQTNDLLLALQQILDKMLELETYNELVDLVRSIVEEQNQLLEKTKEERKRQARSLLED